MSGETPLGESYRAGIMQFQTKITGIEKRLIAKGIEDYPSEKAFLILSRTETENKASTNTQVDKNPPTHTFNTAVIRMVGIRNLFSANL
eukprot:scaffold2172_cov177-Chaetoceros_neogracile.AAC.1